MSTTTTPRKRTARQPQDRKPQQQTVSTIVEGQIEPIRFTSTDAPASPAMTHLFSIDDEDYYVPAEPSAGLSLQFMKRYRQDAIDAQGWLMEELLGADAYEALSNYRGLRPEDLQHLVQAVLKLTMGSVEAATGPLGRG